MRAHLIGMALGADKQVIMFGGKGGVGKTTCASATALHYAKQGLRTLVISTDPTPSLADIFELEVEPEPGPGIGSAKAGRPPGEPLQVAEGLPLYLLELGPEEIKELWDRKFGREVYEVFSSFVDIEYDEFVEFITTVLPGLGEEFMVDYIRELARSGAYDKLVWDTAPLGQTIGLLRMPALLGEHLRAAPRIYSRLRVSPRSRRSVLEILRGWEALSEEDLRFLREEVELAMVTIPEALAVRQLGRTIAELEKYGLKFTWLIVNNVIRADAKGKGEFLQRKARQQRAHLELLRRSYGHLRLVELPLFPYEITGLERLEEVRRALIGPAPPSRGPW